MMSKSNPKPLLFIHTVQTEINRSIGQTVYDSRKVSKEKNVTEENTNPPTEMSEETVTPISSGPVKTPNRETIEEQVLNEESVDLEETKKSSKLQQQVKLLDRRAKLNHFVLVEVKRTDDTSTTGYFKAFIDETIKLQTEEDEIIDIPFTAVEAIHILKV